MRLILETWRYSTARTYYFKFQTWKRDLNILDDISKYIFDDIPFALFKIYLKFISSSLIYIYVNVCLASYMRRIVTLRNVDHLYLRSYAKPSKRQPRQTCYDCISNYHLYVFYRASDIILMGRRMRMRVANIRFHLKSVLSIQQFNGMQYVGYSQRNAVYNVYVTGIRLQEHWLRLVIHSILIS